MAVVTSVLKPGDDIKYPHGEVVLVMTYEEARFAYDVHNCVHGSRHCTDYDMSLELRRALSRALSGRKRDLDGAIMSMPKSE